MVEEYHRRSLSPGTPWYCVKGTDMVYTLNGGTIRDLRVNGDWCKGLREKFTDFFPCFIIEEGRKIFCTKVDYLDGGYTHISTGSVRFRTYGRVIYEVDDAIYQEATSKFGKPDTDPTR